MLTTTQLIGFGFGGADSDASPAAGYKAWWRADSADNTTDGGAVGTITDRSTNGYNVTEGTNKPVYRATGGPSSKPTVEYDGSNDKLSSAVNASNLVTVSAGTIYCVVKALAAGSAADITTGTFWTLFGYLSLKWTNAPRFLLRYYDTGDKTVTNGANLVTGTNYAVRVRWNGSNAFLLVNGGTEQSVAVGNIGSLAGVADLGCEEGLRFLNCQIADWFCYNTCVSNNDATDAAVRSYISTRYSLTL